MIKKKTRITAPKSMKCFSTRFFAPKCTILENSTHYTLINTNCPENAFGSFEGNSLVTMVK